MKKSIPLLITLVFLVSCKSKQETANNNIEDTYKKSRLYDQENNRISQSKFYNQLLKNQDLSWAYVSNKTKFDKRLVAGQKHGVISNKATIIKQLNNTLDIDIASDKPIVIIYYPGKDPCNSGGSATKQTRAKAQQDFEDKLYNLAQIKPIYLYKSIEGLANNYDLSKWHQDPDGLIESLFFEYHYPCSSYLVISKDGEFTSKFGEFNYSEILATTKRLNQ